jgi:hypothetical protein
VRVMDLIRGRSAIRCADKWHMPTTTDRETFPCVRTTERYRVTVAEKPSKHCLCIDMGSGKSNMTEKVASQQQKKRGKSPSSLVSLTHFIHVM